MSVSSLFASLLHLKHTLHTLNEVGEIDHFLLHFATICHLLNCCFTLLGCLGSPKCCAEFEVKSVRSHPHNQEKYVTNPTHSKER